MSLTETRLALAILLPVVLLGCEDDTEKLLSELGVSHTQQDRQAQEESLPLIAPLELEEIDGDDGANSGPDLPGGIGRFDFVHDPAQAAAKIYFADAHAKPINNLQNATLWLAGVDGPVSVPLEPCTPAEPGCLAARSDLLSETAPRGVVRVEIDGQRVRIPLSLRKVESQPAGETQPAALSELATQPHAERNP